MSSEMDTLGMAANQSVLRYRLPFLTMLVLLSFGSSVRADRGPREWAFIRLDYARKEKVQQLRRHCDTVHNLAASIRDDKVMIEFFDANNKYYSMVQNGSAPDALKQKMKEFRHALNGHYVKTYLCFYDILFVNKAGDVIYTIRRESDYHSNVFAGESAPTPLAEPLRRDPQQEVFLDFDYYAPSDEPAAFFVEPATKEGKHIGWFVLQCAINKINSLFAGAEQLGQTGEAFLVNHEGYMLTQSTFLGDSTILKVHLDDKNIEAKFREKQGNKIVTDYRGFTALTSFEVFEFLGIQWLVVTKVDESGHYRAFPAAPKVLSRQGDGVLIGERADQ